jgi:hypothetical protein
MALAKHPHHSRWWGFLFSSLPSLPANGHDCGGPPPSWALACPIEPLVSSPWSHWRVVTDECDRNDNASSVARLRRSGDGIEMLIS